VGASTPAARQNSLSYSRLNVRGLNQGGCRDRSKDPGRIWPSTRSEKRVRRPGAGPPRSALGARRRAGPRPFPVGGARPPGEAPHAEPRPETRRTVRSEISQKGARRPRPRRCATPLPSFAARGSYRSACATCARSPVLRARRLGKAVTTSDATSRGPGGGRESRRSGTAPEAPNRI